MKKIFSSVFIIATIITPLFLLHKVQKVEADWYYSAAFSATSGKADQPPSKANFAVDNTCNDTCAKNKCIAALDTWTKDEFYQTHKSDYIVTGCTSDEVTPLTGKQPAAGDKYDPIYHLLAPIGNFTEIKTDDIGGYFSKIFLIAIGLCGALAVIMFVIGGIQYMGEESIFGKTKGKEQMTSAILGLLIALGSWALLNTINPDLLGGSGLLISSANIKLEPKSGGGYYGGTIGDPNNPNVNKNITEWDIYLKNASQTYGVECTAIKAFMYAESAGVNGLTSPSPANAKGLIQLVDSTFKEQNVGNDPMDPQTNINAGAKYLKSLKSTGCNGKPTSSVCDISNMQYWAASYNGGPGANKESADSSCKTQTIWQCLNNSGYAQTRTYAPRVEANYNKLKEKGWGC